MNPYKTAPSFAFWNKTVLKSDLTGIYKKKFSISPDDQVATAGSCFAQEISRGLRRNGYNLMDVEPFPALGNQEMARAYSYNLYSARYGNIYTSSFLLQLINEAFGHINLYDQCVWELGNNFCDAFRPTLEPKGFDSSDEVVFLRKKHLEKLRLLFSTVNIFIFTLGLTELWRDRQTKTVYPACPGVSGGVFDSNKYEFCNLDYEDVLLDMQSFIKILREVNPTVKFIFTVSPVPLIATATNEHVMTATMRSKSVLRTVVDKLVRDYSYVDYFPSFEIAANPWLSVNGWEKDCRSVTHNQVDKILSYFFNEHPPLEASVNSSLVRELEYIPPHCDEILLAQFGE